MKKKRILFIISNLETGGVSKSITSLINVVDRNRYDVSLMIVAPKGAFMELLPSDIRIITDPRWAALTSRFDGVKSLLKQRRFTLAIGHLMRLMVSVFSRAYAARMIAAMMPAIDDEFDTIVDFNGQQQLYYMVDKLKARKKVTFFHSDYDKWSFYYKTDRQYFPKADYIFSVSDHCVEVLKRRFPAQANKIALMENIVSLGLIDRLAQQPVESAQTGKTTLITIGHLCENKGTSWAIEAAAILKRRGYDFTWKFIGTSNEFDHYRSLARQHDVDRQIEFLGVKVNPYPYIRQASIVVHPTRFEGKSIALDEARLLCKPVVVTNFSTVNDQFTDRLDASICEMTPESIADATAELIDNHDLRNRYQQHLRDNRRDNESEIEKLYTIFDA